MESGECRDNADGERKDAEVEVVGRLELKAAPRTRGRGRAGFNLALMMSAADHRSQATSLDSDRQECGGADASCDRDLQPAPIFKCMPPTHKTAGDSIHRRAGFYHRLAVQAGINFWNLLIKRRILG